MKKFIVAIVGGIWACGAFAALDPSINGTASCGRKLSGNDDLSPCNATLTEYVGEIGNKSGKWAIEFSYGYVMGRSVCSTATGRYGVRARTTELNESLNTEYNTQAGKGILDDNQNQCWCKLDKPRGAAWVFRLKFDDAATCADSCLGVCSYYVKNVVEFRTAIFNTIVDFEAIPVSQAYVDAGLATRQDNFDDLGNTKLMTYSSTAGIVDSRDITTTLGTPNASGIYANETDDSVPTRGAIKAGIDRKQDTISGTAGWAATYSGTTGTVGKKPIYNSTDAYHGALVDAQTLNTAVINAVNSEFTVVPGVGWRLNTAANLNLLPVRLDASINGLNHCYRGLNNQSNSNTTCDMNMRAYLGASGNRSGKWGVGFIYGNIMGYSVCSTIMSSNAGVVSTDAQADALDVEYTAQAGNGTLTAAQKNCWCKMASPYVSNWLFFTVNEDSADCATSCARQCSLYTEGNEAYRGVMFNALQ